jgi:hypothetical protein
MKSQPKPIHNQLNLPLLKLAPATLPTGRDKELARALVELLVSAAHNESAAALAAQGGDDEFEVDG